LDQWDGVSWRSLFKYEAWLSDPIGIKPSAQVVWPIVGQDILNADVGGGFHGKSPPAYFTFGGLLATNTFQLHCTWWLSSSSSDAVCWLVPLSQARS